MEVTPLADRSLLEIVLQTSAGAVRATKSLTLYEEDGTTPLAQTVYDAQSGGSAILAPATNSLGTFRGYVDNPQRGMALASDDATKFPVAYNPDPVDFILQRQSDRSLASLGVGASTALTAAAPLQSRSTYNGWTGSIITTTQAGLYGGIGAITLDDVKRIRETPDVPFIAGVVGAINIPSATTSIVTNSQGIGVAGFVSTYGARNGVALYGETQARAALTTGGMWGVNVAICDQGFNYGTAYPNAGMYGGEFDLVIDHASTVAWGLDVICSGANTGISGAGFVSGTFMDLSRALSVRPNADNGTKWHYALRVDHGAAGYGLSLGFGTNTGAAATGSQAISLDSLSAALVARSSHILANSDGEILLRGGGNGVRFQDFNADQTAAGTTRMLVNASGAAVTGAISATTTVTATTGFVSSRSNAGASQDGISITNSSNTAGSDASFLLTVGGTSGGDAKIVMTVPATTAWGFGVDNSDSDAFVFGPSGTLGASNALKITTAGLVEAPAVMNSAQGVATTAAGALVLRLGASGPNIYTGSGAPTVSAVKGSLYLRTDGSGTTDRAYINTNGSTTWTALTTVA